MQKLQFQEEGQMTGWYAMQRGWQSHPIFNGQEYSERDAWIWLIEHAVHTETRVNIKGMPVTIQRGQLSYSIRFLAQAWGWHRNRAARFLDKLALWNLIETESGSAQNIINICDYLSFQEFRDDSGTERGTAMNGNSRQARDGSGTNNKNDKQCKKKKSTEAKPPKPIFVAPDWIPADAWQALVEHRKGLKIGVTPHALSLAVKQLEKYRALGHDPVEVINQTVLNGWKGLFPLKGENHGNRKTAYSGPHANMLAGFGFADLE